MTSPKFVVALAILRNIMLERNHPDLAEAISRSMPSDAEEAIKSVKGLPASSVSDWYYGAFNLDNLPSK